MRRFLCVVAALVLLATGASGQQGGRSEAELRIELERAQLDETVAREALARKNRLFQEGLISETEVGASAAEVRRAELNTLRARIGVTNELPTFMIVSATKMAGPDGQMRVVIELLPLPDAYGDSVRQYLISLRGPTSILAEPYQQAVTLHGRRAGRQILTFRLLKDVDEVTILITSGTKREEIPVLLQRAHGDRQIVVRAQNFSQEATLGDKADYFLDLERFSSGARDVGLRVLGLPAEMTYEWIDPSSKAKLNSFRFADGQSSARLLLRVYLPAEGATSWLGRVVDIHAEIYEDSAVAGSVALQLRPVGAPKLFITSDNLLVNVAPETSKRIYVTVENTGGVAARDVKLVTTVPIGFELTAVPAVVNLVESGQKTRIGLDLTATPNAIPGEYSMKVRAEAATKLANVESPEQTFRVVLDSAFPTAAFGVGGALVLAGAAAWWLVVRRRQLAASA
jgi:hypothetical protein